VSGAPSLVDVALALGVPALALATLASRDLVRAVALFVALGLALALVWARLGAPDVALAEAALGSGIVGVLLVATLGRLGRADVPAKGPLRSAVAGLLAAGASAGALLFLLDVEPDVAGLRDAVRSRVAETGASYPVTAVLLDLRGYDTLLEIAVLLLAALGVRAARGTGASYVEAPPGPILHDGVRVLVPMIVLVVGYLLWIGTSGPGGAFQAGTVLGAGAVLAALSGAFGGRRAPPWAPRAALALGYAPFVAAAVATLALGRPLLDLPPAGGPLIAIEAGLTVAVALVVRELFEGCSPVGERR
jgi:multisubunit Na+/H+ antiporter MnhB subunit